MKIDRLDHLVLTVRNVETTTAFYVKVLHMEAVTFAGGRRALQFGQQKINLHAVEAPFTPHALLPVPGSADLCFITTTPIADVVGHLQRHDVEIIEGPVPRTGATGEMMSVYFRDPDGNLLEVSNYVGARAEFESESAAAAAPEDGLRTSRLQLRRSTVDHLEALIDGPEKFQKLFGQRVEDGYLEFPEALDFSLRKAREAGELGHWWMPFLVLDADAKAVVGMCGYKGPPDAAGVVEIGYGIARGHRGRGFAAEAARALVAHALEKTEIHTVRAHTLPEVNASTRVLTKCGFTHIGEVNDPEDGLIWRWETTRSV